jgi:hypothetical protein
MALGNLYKLTLNDGKQDMFLEDAKLLNNVIQNINPKLEWKNIINVINKTHYFPINSYIMPSVPVGYYYKKISDFSGPLKFGSTISMQLQNDGAWIFDMVLRVKLKGLQAVSNIDKVRYTEFLGHRLFKDIKLIIAGDVVQKITPDIYNIYYERHVPTSKKIMWKNLIGQEVPYLGTLVSEPKISEIRQYVYIGDGPQTLKTSHPEVELWLPMIFWFNTDITKLLPICALTAADIKIELTINTVDKIVGCTNNSGGGRFIPPTISLMEMFVNHIETIDSIKNIVSSKKIFAIPIRTYETEDVVVNESTGKLQGNTTLKFIKNSVESIYIGFRPLVNEESLISWPQQQIHQAQYVKIPVVTENPSPNTISINFGIYYKSTDCIDKLSFLINDIEIYSNNTTTFFSKYLPYKLQNDSPESFTEIKGWNYIDFSLADRDLSKFTNQFGYINFNKNREFRIDFSSSYISNNTPTRCTVISRAIKLLLVTGNKIQFMYL